MRLPNSARNSTIRC
ncbi:hypothetical protein ACHAW6_008572 [Cyclotella cf. meneghiniana]